MKSDCGSHNTKRSDFGTGQGDSMGQSIKASKCIGDNIQNARALMKMTQEQLAAKMQVFGCDMSRGTLAKIEAGIRHISVEELDCIRKILDI